MIDYMFRSFIHTYKCPPNYLKSKSFKISLPNLKTLKDAIINSLDNFRYMRKHYTLYTTHEVLGDDSVFELYEENLLQVICFYVYDGLVVYAEGA
jgi:hypothetical protein